MFLLLAPAFADVFGAVDEEVTLGRGGTWARLHPSADGWWFFQGSGGDFWTDEVGIDLTGYDDMARIQLTEHGGLQDTQVERCEDGGWLVAGSFTLDTFDDSAHAWSFDADFTPRGEIVIEEREDARAHNDMAILCHSVATGVAYANGRGGGGSTFIDLDTASLTVGAFHDAALNAMGGSLAIRDDTIVAAYVNGPQSSTIEITTFASDWSELDTVSVPVPVDQAFWPQRLLPYGEGWILAYLSRPAMEENTDGAVNLLALDADFGVVDHVVVNAEKNARPWVVRNGDVLGVSYDRDVQPRVTLVHLDPGSVPDDDDLPDTGGEALDDAGGCGCGGGSAAWLMVPGLLVGRRRVARPAVRPRAPGGPRPSTARTWVSDPP